MRNGLRQSSRDTSSMCWSCLVKQQSRLGWNRRSKYGLEAQHVIDLKFQASLYTARLSNEHPGLSTLEGEEKSAPQVGPSEDEKTLEGSYVRDEWRHALREDTKCSKPDAGFAGGLNEPVQEHSDSRQDRKLVLRYRWPREEPVRITRFTSLVRKELGVRSQTKRSVYKSPTAHAFGNTLLSIHSQRQNVLPVTAELRPEHGTPVALQDQSTRKRENIEMLEAQRLNPSRSSLSAPVAGLPPMEASPMEDAKASERTPKRKETQRLIKADQERKQRALAGLESAFEQHLLRATERDTGSHGIASKTTPASRDSYSLFQVGHTQQLAQQAMTRRSSVTPISSLRRRRPTHKQRTAFHTLSRRYQQPGEVHAYQAPPDIATMTPVTQIPQSIPLGPRKRASEPSIRDRLRLWQQEHGQDSFKDLLEAQDIDVSDGTSNNLTRLDSGNDLRYSKVEEDEDREEMARAVQILDENADAYDPLHRFLRRGDLVELEFPKSEREPTIAVYIRRFGMQSQFYTMHGKWVHTPERHVQYSIPGWLDPTMLDKMIPYLPAEEVTNELLANGQMYDLSVPREVSAPVIVRLVEFYRESEEIYRKHASALDNAHDMLAHPTDLKFGSLSQVAMRLLGKPEDGQEIPLTALFTVRKALSHAGFAFGMDKRSHRLTGFIQIRSKDQVNMVEQVRNWIRQYQDYMAAMATLRQDEADGNSKTKQPRMPTEARYVHSYLETVKELIADSRTRRDTTSHGCIGPDKNKLPMTPERPAISMRRRREFTGTDMELNRFMKAWACSQLFAGLPRIEALPPVILQATGLYEHDNLVQATGFVFLQEIGVLMPFENRVRFDQHLLLPSSQHSKPLENLMTAVMAMEDKHGFVDSMLDLRKDWGKLPVFCIDSESALEIDDGLSVEQIAEDDYWVHVHVANPTAFFERDSPLAKMARHMTETIYMPERAYRMLPSWATSRHFSLANDRPVLTFSARLNSAADIKDIKVQPGVVRNVIRMTPQEVAKTIGIEGNKIPEMVLRVGQNMPPPRRRKDHSQTERPEIRLALTTLQRLAEGRQAQRRRAGGLFIDAHEPEITVHSDWKKSGLPWTPSGSAWSGRCDGDPVIQYKSRQLVSWFSTGEDVSDILVREMMLMACEIGAKWAADRNIPAVYRGTVHLLDRGDSKEFYNNVLVPSMNDDGQPPMHVAFDYLRMLGSTMLSIDPLSHQVLGMPHFVKVTSPLRRYGDMIFHWQVEAALREEAKTKQSLIGSDRADYLPFSHSNLRQIMTGLHPRESMIRRATRYASNFWVAQAFFRAFYFGEAELPETFHAYVYTDPIPNWRTASTILKEYSLQCSMIKPEMIGLEEVRAGDWWECKIHLIDCYARAVTMQPIRLIDRAKEVPGYTKPTGEFISRRAFQKHNAQDTAGLWDRNLRGGQHSPRA
ncbi:3'-5' RNA exonuclease complex component [Elasticomyces elasticus]|nr:3'-5' RNA exonuclease complex component [Elasticomyces elasticus]